MRVLIFFVLLLPLSACGRDALPTHMPGPKSAHADVQGWDGSPTLQANKKIVVSTLQREGANDQRIALVLAAAMAETQNMTASERDATKDGAGDAKNFSAFNMNAFALRKLGWSEGQGVDLNQDCGLAEATKLFNRGLNTLGESKFLWLHRGGETAMNDGVSYGCRDYEAAIRAVAAVLMADPSRTVDARRYGLNIAHV